MKRTRIKRVSSKTAAENRKIAAERKAFVQAAGKSECHEMVGGSARSKTKMDRRFWLALNRDEHEVVQYESKARQMARKLIQDPAYFDLEAVNEMYRIGGKEWPITWEQIAQHLELRDE